MLQQTQLKLSALKPKKRPRLRLRKPKRRPKRKQKRRPRPKHKLKRLKRMQKPQRLLRLRLRLRLLRPHKTHLSQQTMKTTLAHFWTSSAPLIALVKPIPPMTPQNQKPLSATKTARPLCAPVSSK